MKVFKPKDSPNYYIDIKNGNNRRRISLHTPDYDLALDRASKYNKSNPYVLFSTAVDDYMEFFYKKKNAWKDGYEAQSRRNDYHCLMVLKKLQAHSKAKYVVDIQYKQLTDFQKSIKHSNNTINKYLAHIRKFFTYCMYQNFTNGNPAGNLKNLKLTKEIPYYFSHEELQTVFHYAENTMNGIYKPFFEFMYETGLRATDTYELSQDNFTTDINGMSIHLIQKKTNKPLIIPISKRAQEIVGSLGEALFPWEKTYIGRNNAIKVLHNSFGDRGGVGTKYCRRHKITLHQFRHTFAMHRLEKEISLEVLKNLMGHASITQTELYARALPQNKLRKALL